MDAFLQWFKLAVNWTLQLDKEKHALGQQHDTVWPTAHEPEF